MAKVEKIIRDDRRPARPRHDRVEHRRHSRTSPPSTPATPAPHTAFLQVALKEDHKVGSYEYMDRVRERSAPRAAAHERLLPVRRLCGRGAQFRHARADRRAGERLERSKPRSTQPRSWPLTSARSAASATSSSRRTSTIPSLRSTSIASAPASSASNSARARQQRDHRADFEPDDRAQLLDRSQEQQRLLLTVQYPESQMKTFDDLRASRCTRPANPAAPVSMR